VSPAPDLLLELDQQLNFLERGHDACAFDPAAMTVKQLAN
jgi:hypothetical protein